MNKLLFPVFFSIILFSSCQKEDNNENPLTPTPASLYFPPLSGTEWQSSTPASLGWNETELNNLYSFLEQKNTKAFIVLENGKMVVEKYFGSFTADSSWYWASAGKTITALLVGIAQQEGLLNISNKTSQYIGEGWTYLPLAKENLVTVRHQLTMTTGLDDAGVQGAQEVQVPARHEVRLHRLDGRAEDGAPAARGVSRAA